MANGIERRRYARLNFFCDLTVTPIPDGDPRPASSVDISLGGVGICAEYFLDRDQIVRIDFHLRDQHHQETVEQMMGRVAYARSDEDGTRIGVEFLNIIQETSTPMLAKRLQELASE